MYLNGLFLHSLLEWVIVLLHHQHQNEVKGIIATKDIEIKKLQYYLEKEKKNMGLSTTNVITFNKNIVIIILQTVLLLLHDKLTSF